MKILNQFRDYLRKTFKGRQEEQPVIEPFFTHQKGIEKQFNLPPKVWKKKKTKKKASNKSRNTNHKKSK